LPSKETFHHATFSERYLNSASYRTDCVQAGAGEHPALPGQLNYLPEISPAHEWPIDWATIGEACGIEADLTAELKNNCGQAWMQSSGGSV